MFGEYVCVCIPESMHVCTVSSGSKHMQAYVHIHAYVCMCVSADNDQMKLSLTMHCTPLSNHPLPLFMPIAFGLIAC